VQVCRFCALIGEHERCDGHIVVEWVGEEILLWRRLLVRAARKVLRGEGEVLNLRRLEVMISKELRDWDYCMLVGGEEDSDSDLQPSVQSKLDSQCVE
jgi:hypothetical protein